MGCVGRRKRGGVSELVFMVSDIPWQTASGSLGQPGSPKALSSLGHCPRPIFLACLGPKNDSGHRQVASSATDRGEDVRVKACGSGAPLP